MLPVINKTIMIRIQEFRRIDIEVRKAIYDAFKFANSREKDKNDYYLFLCNATYVEDYEETKLNPYVLDYRIDGLIDQDRFEFLTRYLRTQYNFDRFNTSDSKESLTIEMMLYSHIWESTNFLKQLTKLLDLCQSKEYSWKTTVPDSQNEQSKQKYIRETLRDGFKNLGLKLGDIISSGYQSQLRNAFAHSDYSFALNDPEIHLHNYKPNGFQIKKISFDDWTKYFCHSFLLNYYLIKTFNDEKQRIDSPIKVFLRNKNGEKKKGEIIYDKERDGFQGRMLEP